MNNTNRELKFFWVVALRPEANALIKKFSLKSFSNHCNFPIYINRKNGHALVISGVGSIKSAVATMYLNKTFNPGQFAAWINIGIAGHFQGPVGTLFQVIKVVNNDNGKSFFPGLRFSKLAKKMIADLFKKNSALIDNLLQAVVKIVDRERARLGDPIEMDGIMCSLHFTETNRLRFRKIYKKWWCLFPNKSLVERAQKASSAHELMQSMELEIAFEAQNWKLK